MRRLKLATWQPLSPSVLYRDAEMAELVVEWPDFSGDESCVDHLTNIPNRKAYDLAFSQAVKGADAQGSGLGLIVLDIDHFKKVNDAYGHATGDVVLKEFAKIAMGGLRETDFLARYGGEEFVLLTPSFKQVFEIGERIRKTIEVQRFSSEQISITCSFGCARYPLDTHIGAELFQLADKALYQAKNNGRNQGVKGWL